MAELYALPPPQRSVSAKSFGAAFPFCAVVRWREVQAGAMTMCQLWIRGGAMRSSAVRGETEPRQRGDCPEHESA